MYYKAEMDFRKPQLAKLSFVGWRKAVALVVTATVGALGGFRAVDLQYTDPDAILLEEIQWSFAGLYLFTGVGIGLILATFFCQRQGRWLVWFVAWIVTLLAIWFAPFIFPSMSRLSDSTHVAWAGAVAFTLVHAAAYLARMVTEPAGGEEVEPISTSDHSAS